MQKEHGSIPLGLSSFFKVHGHCLIVTLTAGINALLLVRFTLLLILKPNHSGGDCGIREFPSSPTSWDLCFQQYISLEPLNLQKQTNKQKQKQLEQV